MINLMYSILIYFSLKGKYHLHYYRKEIHVQDRLIVMKEDLFVSLSPQYEILSIMAMLESINTW